MAKLSEDAVNDDFQLKKERLEPWNRSAISSDQTPRIEEFVIAIEGLEEEKAAVQAHIKQQFDLASGCGYSVLALKELIRRRKLPDEQVDELDNHLNLYEQALKRAGLKKRGQR
ncbi:MAG: DUF2312 domain-containing protein [Magnetococcales bacterium]|nr:DUF2312 domain-containing protein [Magnetococcales bacterium]